MQKRVHQTNIPCVDYYNHKGLAWYLLKICKYETVILKKSHAQAARDKFETRWKK